MYTLDRLLNHLRDAVSNGDVTTIADALRCAIREKPIVSQARSSQLLHSEPGLTVVHIAVNPGFVSPLHDHRTWAVIGIYEGREDNTFYRRTDDRRGVEPSGSHSLQPGEVLPLGVDAIHQITNPLSKRLIALHVYGKNIFNIERSAWDPVTGQERPFQLALDGHGRVRPS